MKTSEKILISGNLIIALLTSSKYGFNLFSILGALIGMYFIPLIILGIIRLFTKNVSMYAIHAVAFALGLLSLIGQNV